MSTLPDAGTIPVITMPLLMVICTTLLCTKVIGVSTPDELVRVERIEGPRVLPPTFCWGVLKMTVAFASGEPEPL